jgi:hypothetical protein
MGIYTVYFSANAITVAQDLGISGAGMAETFLRHTIPLLAP